MNSVYVITFLFSTIRDKYLSDVQLIPDQFRESRSGKVASFFIQFILHFWLARIFVFQILIEVHHGKHSRTDLAYPKCYFLNDTKGKDIAVIVRTQAEIFRDQEYFSRFINSQ